MTGDYKPSKKEVWGEIYNGMKIDNEKREKFREVINEFLGGALIMGTCGYVIPSTVRNFKEPIVGNQENADFYGASCSIGCFTGVGLSIAQIVLYCNIAFKQKHPEVFLIPVATNVIDGIYEIVRKSYKDAEKRVIARKDLVDKLKEEEQRREHEQS